jgi:hypothetical protein
MVIFEITLFAVATIFTVIALIKNTNMWAVALQQYVIRGAERAFGNSEDWRQPWILVLSKILVIWFGLMFIVVVFYFCFGTIHLNYGK